MPLPFDISVVDFPPRAFKRRGGEQPSSGGGGGGPIEPPTGACCCPDDPDCFITDQATCEACCPVCTYMGDDSICDPNPCVVCPNVSLVCNSAYATKSKCGGFLGFEDGIPGDCGEGNYGVIISRYREYSVSVTISDSEGGPTTGPCYFSGSCDISGTLIATFEADPYTNCGGPTGAYQTSCSGEIVVTCGDPDGSSTYNCAEVEDFPDNVHVFACRSGLPPNTSYEYTDTTFTTHWDAPDDFPNLSATRYETLSNEYSTEDLISDTVAAVPSFSGEFGPGDCQAIRYVNPCTEESCSIQRVQYKFTFDTVVIPFTIYWTERFTDQHSGDFTDSLVFETQSVGSTESSTFEILEPTSNGTTTVVNVRWSFDSIVCGESECGDPPIFDGSSCNPTMENCTGQYDNCCVESCGSL